MAVIALSMETGAFGESFVDHLAAELGVKVVDLRPFELGIAEHFAFRGGGVERDDAERLPPQAPASAELEALSLRVATEILAAAAADDALIVSWSAAAVLSSLGQVSRVCVRAPEPQEVWWAIHRFGQGRVSPPPRPDESPRSYFSRLVRRAFGPKWHALHDFDLVLDVDRRSAQVCRCEIVSLVQRRRSLETDEARAELARLCAHLREAERTTQHSEFVRGCAVSIGADDVPLTGIYSQEGAIAKVEQHLRGAHEMAAPADPFCRRMED